MYPHLYQWQPGGSQSIELVLTSPYLGVPVLLDMTSQINICVEVFIRYVEDPERKVQTPQS